MMKKFLAVFLTLAMVFALSSVAMAVELNPTIVDGNMTDNTAENNVTITANKVTPATKYHVLVQWESLAFTYTETSSVWNVQTHTYDVTGSWSTAKTITIENHSNAGIMYSAAYAAGEAEQVGIVITPTVTSADNGTLGSADHADYRQGTTGSLASGYQKGPQGTITVAASGTPVNPKDGVVIGTVTVTIDPAS